MSLVLDFYSSIIVNVANVNKETNVK